MSKVIRRLEGNSGVRADPAPAAGHLHSWAHVPRPGRTPVLPAQRFSGTPARAALLTLAQSFFCLGFPRQELGRCQVPPRSSAGSSRRACTASARPRPRPPAAAQAGTLCPARHRAELSRGSPPPPTVLCPRVLQVLGNPLLP